MSHKLAPTNFVSRLAPTPSGYLHIGNAYSFVLTALLVKSNNGCLHLRIDDIDSERMRLEFVDDIFEQLEWLGLQIDKGPSNTQDFKKNYSQLLNLEMYNGYIEQLVQTDKVYACTCSRSQIAAASSNSQIYPGTCRSKKLDLHNPQFHLRYNTQLSAPIMVDDLQMGLQAVDLKNQMGDFIVKRRGGMPSYQVVSMVDDIQNEINLVVRGEDLLPSTAAQIELSRSLNKDLSKRVTFLHHPLLAEGKDAKLSKSHGSLSLARMKELGTTRGQMYGFLAKAYGLRTNKVTNFEEMLEEFQQTELKLESISGIKI